MTKTISVDEIIINPEYHALVPKPSAEDEKSMEESIKKLKDEETVT